MAQVRASRLAGKVRSLGVPRLAVGLLVPTISLSSYFTV